MLARLEITQYRKRSDQFGGFIILRKHSLGLTCNQNIFCDGCCFTIPKIIPFFKNAFFFFCNSLPKIKIKRGDISET